MKKFLKIVSKIMEQLDYYEKYDESLLDSMKEAYEELSSVEKRQGLSLLSELLKEDYKIYLYFMSMFLAKLEEEEAVCHINQMLCSDIPSLWERIEIMYQQKALLFRKTIVKDQQRAYGSIKEVYKEILRELTTIMRGRSWISQKDRRKSIALIVNQLLGRQHSPSRKLLSICRYFEELGYEVMIYVSFFPGQTKKNYCFLWYEGYKWDNQVEKTMPFVISTEGGEIRGHNLYLEEENYLYGFEKMVGMIYNQRPEFVFELGDVTLLAGLCQAFTTVVTMGCTKMVPVTTAPVIARYFVYSEEEDEAYRQSVGKEQTVIDVMHKDIEESQIEIETLKRDTERIRQELGITQEQFVILIVGNRLDSEVDDSFRKILCQILGRSEKCMCLFVGKCEELQKSMEDSIYGKQMIFAGYRPDFREVIAMGDLFLNPPRQGGGTGALYAALMGIPVVTLGQCDVESTVGKSFVCGSVEEMPELVLRYMTDKIFYEEKKKEIREYVEKELKVDSIGNFKNLCGVVKEITLHMEESGENGYGK